MKRSYLLILLTLFCAGFRAQVIFSNSFGNLALQSYTAGSVVTQYTTVPPGFTLINDGLGNNVGSAAYPNSPFHVPSLKTTGWATVYNATDNDTFLVSTSWLDTLLTADRWVITPPITNITANTILTWLAKSPDGSYPDGYEVYGTIKTGALTSADFSVGDCLFSLPDGHTAGGGEKSIWTRHSVSLGSFAGQTLRFAFRDNSTGMYQLWIDNIEVKTLPLSIDGAVSAINTQKYVLVNSSNTVAVTYSNSAATTIYTVTLNYQYGTSSPVTQVFPLASPLGYGEATKLTFSFPYSFSSPGCYPVKVWAILPNNLNDQNLTNDTLYTNVTVQTLAPKKNLLVEQFISVGDPQSPDAQEKLKIFQSDSVISVNIHGADSLKGGNSFGVLLYKKHYSTAMIDRTLDSTGDVTITRPYYANRISTALRGITPASVTIVNKSYNSGNRQLSFTVKADFVGEVKGDYRVNAYLVENNVSGSMADTSVNGYNQLNGFYNVPWSPYYQTGYFSQPANAWVLNAWQYKHQRVLTYSFDGSFGNPGLIPQTGGTQNQSYQATYSMTIPTPTTGIGKYIDDNIYIVGFIAEYNTDPNKRKVLNATQDKLTANPEIVGIKSVPANLSIGLYPNPTNGLLYLSSLTENRNYEVRLYDLLGKCVFSQSVKNTYNTEKLDLSDIPEGAYILNISSEGRIYREKIVKQNN